MLNLGWVWCVKAVELCSGFFRCVDFRRGALCCVTAVGVRCDMLLRGAISSVKFGYVTAVGVWCVWVGCVELSYVLLSSVKAVELCYVGERCD